MYSWKISTKAYWIFLVQTIIYFVLFLVTIIILLTYAESFKKEIAAENFKIEIVTMKDEYASYQRDFGIDPDKTGIIMFGFYDEFGKSMITTKELAQEYVNFNYKTDNLFSLVAMVSAFQFALSLVLIFMALIQRRSCIFAILGVIAALLKLFTSFGVTYYSYLGGLLIETLAVVLVIFELKKIKIENIKIENRKEIYN